MTNIGIGDLVVAPYGRYAYFDDNDDCHWFTWQPCEVGIVVGVKTKPKNRLFVVLVDGCEHSFSDQHLTRLSANESVEQP